MPQMVDGLLEGQVENQVPPAPHVLQLVQAPPVMNWVPGDQQAAGHSRLHVEEPPNLLLDDADAVDPAADAAVGHGAVEGPVDIPELLGLDALDPFLHQRLPQVTIENNPRRVARVLRRVLQHAQLGDQVLSQLHLGGVRREIMGYHIFVTDAQAHEDFVVVSGGEHFYFKPHLGQGLHKISQHGLAQGALGGGDPLLPHLVLQLGEH
mmetsp:Transcript_20360/g.46530  ORF Transcript_20360/g.46530 Transcript_20360/m.46530 type:complete len:208 (+) Transcript_20360:926-1549(+)